jgi:4-hydroxy-tetrahydrodipicolinate reductase
MEEIKVVQIGMGPLGIKIADFISQRKGIKTVASIDKDPNLIGTKLNVLNDNLSRKITIESDLETTVKKSAPDVAILTTVSDMKRITPQIFDILKLGIPVVSTCEELSYPWKTAESLAQQIDQLAKEHNVAVLGTGVNPGFLMDSLPSYLTSVCHNVESVLVSRYQNAAYRRIPFQKKIGAGLTLTEFENRKKEGTLRHVGLTESIQFIAAGLGWELDKTEDSISPVIAAEDIKVNGSQVSKGCASGVCQIGKGYVDGEVKVTLTFQAAIGELESYDEIEIKGSPNIKSRIVNGVNGDIATCAITINATKQILNAQPGLRTMADIPLPSYFSK